MYDVGTTLAPSGLSFRRLAVIGRRQWWVVAGCVLLAVAGSVGYVKTRAVTYTVQATVSVTPPSYGGVSTGSGSASSTATTALLFATNLNPVLEIQSPAVVKAATAAAHGYVQLTGSLSADQSAVFVSVTAPSAVQAAAAANAAASAFVTQRIKDLHNAANALNPSITKLSTEIKQYSPKGASGSIGGSKTILAVLNLELNQAFSVQATYDNAAGNVSYQTKVTAIQAFVNGKGKKVYEVALAAGILAGLGIALAREQFDDKIRSPSEVSELGPVEVLAELPLSDLGHGSATIADKPFGELAEAVRELRTALRFLSVKRPIRTVLVTSAGAGEGKSFVAANLAAAWAISGIRTILVSSDMRRPSLEHLLQAGDQRRGLSEAIVDAALVGHGRSISGFSYLRPDADGDAGAPERPRSLLDDDDDEPLNAALDIDDLLVATGVDNLMLLPSGPSPPNPAELLGSPEMGKLLVSLRERAEVLVLDSPPVLAVTDALVLTAQADGVLFVVAQNRTSRSAAQRALRQLESGLAPLLGVVVNRSSRSADAY